ncbi:unnamed protein product, partial [Prorocentrum cordatum]
APVFVRAVAARLGDGVAGLLRDLRNALRQPRGEVYPRSRVIAAHIAAESPGDASRGLAPSGGGQPPPDPPPAAEAPLEPEAPSAEACAAWVQPAPPCVEPTVELRPPSIEECVALLQECSASAGQEPGQQFAYHSRARCSWRRFAGCSPGLGAADAPWWSSLRRATANAFCAACWQPCAPAAAGFGRHQMNEGDELVIEYAVHPPLLLGRTVVGVSQIQPFNAVVVTPDNGLYVEELEPANTDIRAWYRRTPGGGPPPAAAAGIPVYDFAQPLMLADFHALRPAALRLVAEHDAALAAAGAGDAVVPAGLGPAVAAAAAAPIAPAAAAGPAGLTGALAPLPVPGAPAPACIAAAAGAAGAAAAFGPAALAGGAGLPPAAAGDDFRTLAVTYDEEGRRHKQFGEGVRAMRQQTWPDWFVLGPCTVLWCANYMLENGGSAVGHHIALRSACRLGLDGPIMVLRSEMSKIFQTALYIAALELICRQIHWCEEKLKGAAPDVGAGAGPESDSALQDEQLGFTAGLLQAHADACSFDPVDADFMHPSRAPPLVVTFGNRVSSLLAAIFAGKASVPSPPALPAGVDFVHPMQSGGFQAFRAEPWPRLGTATVRDDWMKERREGCIDIRLNGDQRSRIGRRDVDFRDAVEQMEQVELADCTDLGPRAMGEFITSVAVGSGNLTSYQAELERMSGVFSGGAQCHEHRSLLEIARRAICMDQLNVKNLHCMEALVRRVIQIEMAVQRNPRHPDFSGLEDAVAGPTGATGSAAVPRYTEFVVARQKDRANILKQMRLHKEELDRERPSDDGGKRNRKDKEKDKGKKKKKAVQRSVLESVQERIDFYGNPSSEAVDGERSLREILRSTDQYELEPQHLASYDVTRLRVCNGDIHPVPVTDLLPAEIGFVGFRRAIKSRCGAFFVHKKDGNIRFICDARATNMCHRLPPRTVLGGAACLSEIDLSGYATAHGGFGGVCEPRFSGADVKDCFCQLANEEMGSWFGFDFALTVEDWDLGITRVWDDDVGGLTPARAGELLFPCLRVLPMGWAWALYFPREAVAHQRPGKPLAAAYVDNFTGVGGSAADAELGVRVFEERAAEAGLALHAADVAVEELESLGLVLCGADRRVRQKPRRVWRFYFATKALLKRGRATGAELRVWAGHAVAFLGLQPCLLSIQQGVYHFIGDGSRRRAELPATVRGELRMAAIACFLTEVDLGAPLADEVHVSDSSSSGFCLMCGRKPLRAVWDAYRWRERWRFVEVEADGNSDAYAAAYLNQLRGVTDGFGATLDVGARKHADTRVRAGQPAGAWRETELGKLLFRRAAVGRGAPRRWASRPRRTQEVELLNVVPALPTALASDSGWATAVEGRWKYDEHINVKEGRICVAGLRRSCRTRARHGRRALSLCDNLVCCCCFDKGRARSRVLNSLCRKAAAYSVGCRVRWRVRHAPTDLNVADEGSRRDRARDPEWLLQKKRAASGDAACGAATDYLAHRGALFGRAGAAERARLSGRSRAQFMRELSVAESTRRLCATALEGFESWCDEVGRQTNSAKDADENMVHWFAQMFFDGMGPGTGRNGLFGWILLRGEPFQDGRQLPPRARRQLKAWERADPGQVALSYPLILIWAIALDLLNHGLVRMAACVVLQTDLYSRPLETLELPVADILRSQPAAGRAFAGRWAVVFAPSESGRKTKTGQTGDTVDVGVCGREWVRDIVAALKDLVQAGEHVFDFDLATYEREFRAALVRLRLQAVGGSPHWLRHSGPSNDRFEKRADLQSIQKRGRWVSFKSVTRYDKHAQLLKQLEKCEPSQIRSAMRAASSLPARLLRSLREMTVRGPVPRSSGSLAEKKGPASFG